jgi:hypothetical protein
MTFDSEDWRRRVKLAQTDYEMTALALDLNNKPRDLRIKDQQERYNSKQDSMSESLILDTRNGKIEIG